MNVHLTALGHRVPLGSSPIHNSERERVTCTPDCQASSRVKERIHAVQELQHCLKPEMSTDPGNTGPTCGFSSRRWGSELQMMSLMALIASNYWCAALKADASYSLGFFCVWGVLSFSWGFYFPDNCQAIKDDDFVLFFSLSFCATILCNSRSPWAKDLASLSTESVLPQHWSQKPFPLNFTHILGNIRFVQKF